ncbi:unnamed protein product [Diatraea saccharalis]|uniref:Uncharacterized protein n=1 Tax=Diatraea saccharalis TaxID=40085 RepID=A0A9P0CDC0_9NEOP|nr:unnamed protein product [Diatraea saccharalis]
MLHCPCYDAHEEFQKIVDLKNTGVVIYRLNSHLKYINEESVMKSTSKNPEDIFILHNTKENDIISANVMEAFDKYGISCPRCIHLLKSAKKMLEIVPKVKGNEIMGVCDHCLKKLTSCIKCDKVVKEFLKTRKDDDSECKKQNLKKHLSKVNILLNDVIWKNKLVREKSGILSHLNFLNLRHNTPALSPEPEIDNALDPGTMRKSSPWARLRRHRSLHIHPGVTKTKRGKTVTKNVLFSSRSHEDLTYGDDWSSIGDDDTLHSETLNSADEATRKSHDMNFEFNKEHDSKIDKTIYDNYETTKNWRDINFELNKQRDSKIDKLKNKQYIKLETDVDTKSILDTLKLTKSMPDVHTVFEKSLLHTLSQKYNSEDSFLNVISGLDDDQLNNGFEYCFPKEVDDSTKKLPRLASSSELISNTQNMLREIAEKERNKREEEHSRKRKEKEEKQIALKEKRSKEKERLLHEEETKEKKEIAFDDTKKEKTLTDDDLKHNLERTQIEAESIEQKKEIETIENVESKQTKEASKKNKIEQSHNQKVVITRDKLKKVKEKSYDEPVESKEEPSSSNRKQLTKSLSDKTTEDLKKGFSKNRDNKDISITEKDVQHTRDRKKPLNDSMSKREDVVTKKEKELEDTIERKKKDSNMKSDKDNETKKERHKKDLRPAHEESKEKSSKEIENVNSKSPVKDNEQKKTKENDAKNVKENNAGKDDKAAADEFLKLLAAQNKQKEEDSKQKKLMEDQQRKANEAADKATSNVTKKQSSPHTKKPAKKLPSPLSPKTKRDHFEPNKADLSITHIKMKKQSGDDLLLRLVRLHKSGARKILYKKNDEQKARDMLARHKRHNKDLKNGCIICNQSDIELELESLLGHKNIGDEFANMIIGEKIYKYKAPLKDEQISIFKLADKNIEEIEKKNEEPPEKECLKTPSPVTAKGTKAVSSF